MPRARVWRCGDLEIALDRPLVMGILNVTPDSFSDGGRFETAETAIEAGLVMLSEGASLIDVGGESTRPGSDPVSPDDELDRVLPVVRGLAAAGALVSIDTRNAKTASQCLAAGASVLNDVSGFRDDEMIEVAASSGCGCIVMHMLGEPKTMQSEPPIYGEVVEEVQEYLEGQASLLEAAGIEHERIAIDPGIGFGKAVEHNLELIRRIDAFADSGYAVVLGASRKAFIGAVLGAEETCDRLEGSLAVAAYAAGKGASVLRVHDVRETVRVLEMLAAIDGGGSWIGPGVDDPIALQRAQEAVMRDYEVAAARLTHEEQWVPVAGGVTSAGGTMPGGVLDLLYVEAVLRDAGVPCMFDPARPGESWAYPGVQNETRLLVPESQLSRARRLLSDGGGK